MTAAAGSFTVGDLVRWTSSAGGVWRHHVGVIVAEVPPGAMPYDHLPPGRWALRCRDNAARPDASYLVALKRAGGRGGGQLYRPRVRNLRHYAHGAAVVIEGKRDRRGRSGQLVPVHPARRQAPQRRLANGATFRARQEGRALVIWRPRWSPRDVRIAAMASPVLLALLHLLVTGMTP